MPPEQTCPCRCCLLTASDDGALRLLRLTGNTPVQSETALLRPDCKLLAINESNRLAVLQESPGRAMQLHCLPLGTVLQAWHESSPGACPTLLCKCGSFEIAARCWKEVLTCLSLQQLFSKQLCDHPGMQWLLPACQSLACSTLQDIEVSHDAVTWDFWAWLRPLGAMARGPCATLAGSEQGGSGLDGDMVQTYDFLSASGQPRATPEQDTDPFDSLGRVKGLCLAALVGSDVADPVRTSLAPQLIRHQSLASRTVPEGTAAHSGAVIHLSAPVHSTVRCPQSSGLSVGTIIASVERSACYRRTDLQGIWCAFVGA